MSELQLPRYDHSFEQALQSRTRAGLALVLEPFASDLALLAPRWWAAWTDWTSSGANHSPSDVPPDIMVLLARCIGRVRRSLPSSDPTGWDDVIRRQCEVELIDSDLVDHLWEALQVRVLRRPRNKLWEHYFSEPDDRRPKEIWRGHRTIPNELARTAAVLARIEAPTAMVDEFQAPLSSQNQNRLWRCYNIRMFREIAGFDESNGARYEFASCCEHWLRTHQGKIDQLECCLESEKTDWRKEWSSINPPSYLTDLDQLILDVINGTNLSRVGRTKQDNQGNSPTVLKTSGEGWIVKIREQPPVIDRPDLLTAQLRKWSLDRMIDLLRMHCTDAGKGIEIVRLDPSSVEQGLPPTVSTKSKTAAEESWPRPHWNPPRDAASPVLREAWDHEVEHHANTRFAEAIKRGELSVFDVVLLKLSFERQQPAQIADWINQWCETGSFAIPGAAECSTAERELLDRYLAVAFSELAPPVTSAKIRNRLHDARQRARQVPGLVDWLNKAPDDSMSDSIGEIEPLDDREPAAEPPCPE